MTAWTPEAVILSGELARELGQASIFKRHYPEIECDFYAMSDSDPERAYAMCWTDDYAVHQGEGCLGEQFRGSLDCHHSRENSYGGTMTTSAIVKSEGILTPAPVEFSAQQVQLIKDQIAKGVSDGELQLFIATCRRTGLDPFMRQIYAITRRSQENGQWVTRMTIQVGIDGMRLIADRTGKYGGQDPTEFLDGDGAWSTVWTGPTKEYPFPIAARATVFRKDYGRPTIAICRWASYVQTTGQGGVTSMWAKMPDVMLGKCAEALALRRAFPAEMSGFAAMADPDYDANADAQELAAAAPERIAVSTAPIEGEVIDASPEPAPAAEAGSTPRPVPTRTAEAADIANPPAGAGPSTATLVSDEQLARIEALVKQFGETDAKRFGQALEPSASMTALAAEALIISMEKALGMAPKAQAGLPVG